MVRWLCLIVLLAGSSLARAQTPDAEAHNRAGRALFEVGDFPGAVREFRAAIGLDPNARYFFNLCVTLERTGDYAGAIAACDEIALRDAPDDLRSKASVRAARLRRDHPPTPVVVDRPVPPPPPPETVQPATPPFAYYLAVGLAGDLAFGNQLDDFTGIPLFGVDVFAAVPFTRSGSFGLRADYLYLSGEGEEDGGDFMSFTNDFTLSGFAAGPFYTAVVAGNPGGATLGFTVRASVGLANVNLTRSEFFAGTSATFPEERWTLFGLAATGDINFGTLTTLHVGMTFTSASTGDMIAPDGMHTWGFELGVVYRFGTGHKTATPGLLY